MNTFLISVLRILTIALLGSLVLPAVAHACIGYFQPRSGPIRCALERDCPPNSFCQDGICVGFSQESASQQSSSQWSQTSDASSPVGFVRLPDDGGADALCGADRRCRIERIKSRNRQRRSLEIAHQERAVQREVERILERQKEEVHRLDRPWLIALQFRGLEYGLLGGYTFGGHLRLEANFLYGEDWIYYTPTDTSLPSINGNHRLRTFGAHATYLPSRRWFSPLISVGFSMAHGSLGGSGSSPDVAYHLLNGALGAEAQLAGGFHLRLALRHGRVIYNQARFGPGSYDRSTRNALREYMNNEGLFGIDFSIGWAF